MKDEETTINRLKERLTGCEINQSNESENNKELTP